MDESHTIFSAPICYHNARLRTSSNKGAHDFRFSPVMIIYSDALKAVGLYFIFYSTLLLGVFIILNLE